ncbi:MAG: hypothetical protein HDR29_03260 [Lachnospiraceae bacterium]|nr:hypothetical protein [Lachnospiraceae bacterium]
MKNNRKLLHIIITSVIIGAVMELTEYAAHQFGLELRTFAQSIKGIYLWLIMPFILLFTANSYVKSCFNKAELKQNADIRLLKALSLLREVAVVILFIGIWVVAFFRGMFYVFTSEMVTEEIMADGYIQGEFADFLSESYYKYYAPVAAIFREPFTGWSEEELVDKVHEKYSEQAEFVEKQADGWNVFRMPDILVKGEYIYFHVSDDYSMDSNALFQILLSEAAHFWNGMERYVTVGSNIAASLEDAMDKGDEAGVLDSSARLCVTCYGDEDIAVCASQLIDWLEFVKDVGQFPYDKDEAAYKMLANIKVGSGSDYFYFSMYPLEDCMGDASWEIKYHMLCERLDEAFTQHYAYIEEHKKSMEEAVVEQNNELSDESEESYYHEPDTDFTYVYDGSYEKEYLIGDGEVRYRMIVEDAALGKRFYGLIKSKDGGENWHMFSWDPFGGQMGMGVDFTFLDENFGFATLAHNGGDSADLYVTKDGGISYQFVIMQGYTVTLEDGYTYNPYDYPQMPYEEDGILYVRCGQGADGDYDGGDSAGLALYKSQDGGNTFTFAEIITPDI